jgi:hypothetical protein
MSGLFVSPPSGSEDQERLPKKLDYEQRVAAAFNMITCELSLGGLVVEPVTPVYIGSGRFVDGHAVVMGVGGGVTPRTCASLT